MIPANSISTLATLLFLMLIGGCASAPDEASADGGYASVEIEDDPDRLICKREKDTGSRLSTRICKTADQWERERIESQDAMRNATKRPQPPSALPSAGGG
jgi:hypothetical protein